MFEELLNSGAGKIEGLTYPKTRINLDQCKYSLGITQSKILYPHAVNKDGTLYSVIRTTEKSLHGISIADFPFEEKEARGMLAFFLGNLDANDRIGKADRLLLKAFGINADTDVYALTEFKLPLAKQKIFAFHNKSDPDKPFGVRSSTISLHGVNVGYAFFTKNDVSVMNEALK
jgi:hypothetical protein